MGSKLSRFLAAWQTAKRVSELYEELSTKISESPGIPVSNPSFPYWTDPPSHISRHGENDVIPSHADIVVIGSGITGAAIARTVLDNYRPTDSKPLSIVMLEARDVCSGATGRNGGHITPVLYSEYQNLKEEHGIETAKKIIRFRLAHLRNLLAVAEQEDLLFQSQCREVETFDVFFDRSLFECAKKQLLAYQFDLPEEGNTFRIIEDKDEIQRLQLTPLVSGCISTVGGAVHPYRLVTGVLSRLLQQYQTHFRIFARTPCISISIQVPSQLSDGNNPYIVRTARGDINTRHVIHATNGWISHLLPGMRRKVIPARGNMTAQRPGSGLYSSPGVNWNADNEKGWAGRRSFVFYPGNSTTRFDYLTQQPLPVPAEFGSASSKLTSAGEMMFGGGYLQGGIAEKSFFGAVGNADDRDWDFSVTSFLSGALALYFQPGWGKEGCSGTDNEGDDNKWEKGRLIAPWSGILGISADGFPWVGRIPETVTGRPLPQSLQVLDITPSLPEKLTTCPAAGLSPPGEWISAGYTGEGMPHAWMCGTALAHMVLKTESVPPLDPDIPYSERGEVKNPKNEIDWLPDVFLITEERWKKANVDQWLGRI